MNKPMNMVFIMCDDHTAQAISAYGSSEIETPNIDFLHKNGIRFDNCCCTNSLCAPSRASILTGKYSNNNGVRTLKDKLDHSNTIFPEILQEAGYKTGLVGKWHLGHGKDYNPKGFDTWEILIDQGEYFDPIFESNRNNKADTASSSDESDTVRETVEGYVTDIITDKSIRFIENVDPNQPFFLMCNHKAPHRPWLPAPKYKDLYADHKFSYPETFNDDYDTRSPAAKEAKMRIEQLTKTDTKEELPPGLSPKEEKEWKYQRYMQDYFACVKSVDDSVEAILKCLRENDLLDNTIIFYTSDQGFYLGEHGWFDKRFMYEESLHMPLIIYHPNFKSKSRINNDLVTNIDFAPTILELAQVRKGLDCDGKSFAKYITGENDQAIHDFIYYRYWDYPSPHNVYPHFGIKNEKYKLMCFYLGKSGEKTLADTNKGISIKEIVNNPNDYKTWWEFYNLEDGSHECNNEIDNVKYKDIIEQMKEKLINKTI